MSMYLIKNGLLQKIDIYFFATAPKTYILFLLNPFFGLCPGQSLHPPAASLFINLL